MFVSRAVNFSAHLYRAGVYHWGQPLISLFVVMILIHFGEILQLLIFILIIYTSLLIGGSCSQVTVRLTRSIVKIIVWYPLVIMAFFIGFGGSAFIWKSSSRVFFRFGWICNVKPYQNGICKKQSTSSDRIRRPLYLNENFNFRCVRCIKLQTFGMLLSECWHSKW